MDDPLETTLRQHLSVEPEPADNGFSARLLAALPPQPRNKPTSVAAWVRRAQWTAMSLSGGGLALVPPVGAGPEAASAVAVYALIGLLVFWSLPWRYNGR